MPYDANGNWTADVPKTDEGWVISLVDSVLPSINPYDHLHQMTASKAAPLIQKQVG